MCDQNHVFGFPPPGPTPTEPPSNRVPPSAPLQMLHSHAQRNPDRTSGSDLRWSSDTEKLEGTTGAHPPALHSHLRRLKEEPTGTPPPGSEEVGGGAARNAPFDWLVVMS